MLYIDKANVGGIEYEIADTKGRSMISDKYDPAVQYVVGDICIYEGSLYKCTAATTGTWNAAKWSKTTVKELCNVSENLFTMELLWTNPNIAQAFGKQEIAIDTTLYGGIAVIGIATLTSPEALPIVFIDNNLKAGRIGAQGATTIRKFTFTDASISIDNAIKIGSTVTTDNTFCIPYKIYGIKIS